MSVRSLRVLIVEDQLLIGKQLETILTGAGHDVLATIDNADDAREAVVAAGPEIVFLDVSLSDGATGLDVARFVAERSDAHVVFTTANHRRIPPDYCGGVGVVEKPFTRAGILSAVNYIAARLSDCANIARIPESLKLSPAYRARWSVTGG